MSNRIPSTLIQLFQYLFVGGIAALVDIGSFKVLVGYFSIDYRLSVFLSFSLGTLTNFSLCNAFIFRRKSLPIWLACARHYLSSLGGLTTNLVVMLFLVEILHLPHLLAAKTVATGSAFVINFLLIKFYAFNSEARLVEKVLRGR